MIFEKINSDVAIGRIPKTEDVTVIVRDREAKGVERWVAAVCSKEDLEKLLNKLP